MTSVTLSLPPALIADLRLMAAERDETPGTMIRVLLMREVARQVRAQPQKRSDTQLVAQLKRRLVPDIDAARSWADLDLRFGRLGYALRLAGGAPVVEDAAGKTLCALSDLGSPYGVLVRRFGRPMPRHLSVKPQARTQKAAEVSPDGPVDLVEPV